MDSVQNLENSAQGLSPQFPVQQQLAENNSTVKKSKKRIIILIISVTIALLLFAAVILYLTYSKPIKEYNDVQKNDEQVENDLPAPPKPTPLVFDEISVNGWKTFGGKYVGINFKYPNNWYEVDSRYVSQVPSEVYFKDRNTYGKDKIANHIWIRRYSTEIDNKGYSKNLKIYNLIKDSKLNEQIKSETLDDEGNYYSKVMEGKISSGQSYVMFTSYSIETQYDEESLTEEELLTGDIPDEKIKYIISPGALAVYIQDGNALYELNMQDYDLTGQNILYNLVKSAKISKNSIPNKVFENGFFSFEYSPFFSLRENVWPNFPVPKGDIRLMLEPLDYIETSPIVIRSVYIDPNKYNSGSFKNLGSWWNQTICRYLGEPFWYDGFSVANGYINVFSNQDDDTGNGYDEYIVSKPYIIKFYSEEQDSAQIIKKSASTLKFRTPKEELESEMASYLKDKSKSSQDINLKCDGSTFFVQ